MRTMTTLVGLSLVLFAVGTLLPAASAHTCSGVDPANTCGPCYSGDHYHTDTQGNVYCESDEGGGDPSIVCFSQISLCLP